MTASEVFFTDGIMYEPCEARGSCNVDQRSFKAYFGRWLAAAGQLAPFTHDIIKAELATSAAAAVKTCTAGTSGTQCGLKWTTGVNDGSLGVGEQMAVLEIVQGQLVDQVAGWVSAVKGTGTSQGDANAGTGSTTTTDGLVITPATTAGRVGAGFLTGLLLISVVGGSSVMIME